MKYKVKDSSGAIKKLATVALGLLVLISLRVDAFQVLSSA